MSERRGLTIIKGFAMLNLSGTLLTCPTTNIICNLATAFTRESKVVSKVYCLPLQGQG